MAKYVAVQAIFLASLLVIKADAAGYSESKAPYYGVETFNTYAQFSFTYGPLKMAGFAFGNTGTSVTFSSWASGATCNYGSGALSGFQCVDVAIQNSTYLAANGATTSVSSDVSNTILLGNVNNGIKTSSYSVGNDGQGPSCGSTQGGGFTPQASNCTNLGTTNTPTGRFTFQTRGLKVTCKNACQLNQNTIDPTNWENLLTQLSQFLNSQNYFAARFVVSRTTATPAFVAARCRITIPNVSEYGFDVCPDSIPATGGTAVAADSNPQS